MSSEGGENSTKKAEEDGPRMEATRNKGRKKSSLKPDRLAIRDRIMRKLRPRKDEASGSTVKPREGDAKETRKDNPSNQDQAVDMGPITISPIPEKCELEEILDVLQKEDIHEIFAEPVDETEVEDYYEIIKEPMDFGTMRARLHEGLYTEFEQFENDAFLIFKNAMHFNSANTIFYKQARRMQEVAKHVFHSFKTDRKTYASLFLETNKRMSLRSLTEANKSVLNTEAPPEQTAKGVQSSRPGPSSARRGMKRKSRKDARLKTRDRRLAGEKNVRKNTSISQEDKRSSYKPWASYFAENKPIISTLCDDPKQLMEVNGNGMGYRDSLAAFTKHLGPTAKMVADRKLAGLSQTQTATPSTLAHLTPMPLANNNFSSANIPTTHLQNKSPNVSANEFPSSLMNPPSYTINYTKPSLLSSDVTNINAANISSERKLPNQMFLNNESQFFNNSFAFWPQQRTVGSSSTMLGGLRSSTFGGLSSTTIGGSTSSKFGGSSSTTLGGSSSTTFGQTRSSMINQSPWGLGQGMVWSSQGQGIVLNDHGGSLGQGVVLKDHGGSLGQGVVLKDHGGSLGQGVVLNDHGGSLGQGVVLKDRGGSLGQGVILKDRGGSLGQGVVLKDHGGSLGQGWGVREHGGIQEQGIVLQDHGGSLGQGWGVKEHGGSHGQGIVVKDHGGSLGRGWGLKEHGGGQGQGIVLKDHGGSLGQGWGLKEHGGSLGQGMVLKEAGGSLGRGWGLQEQGGSLGQGMVLKEPGGSLVRGWGLKEQGGSQGQGMVLKDHGGSLGQGVVLKDHGGSQGQGVVLKDHSGSLGQGWGLKEHGASQGQGIVLKENRGSLGRGWGLKERRGSPGQG